MYRLIVSKMMTYKDYFLDYFYGILSLYLIIVLHLFIYLFCNAPLSIVH